MSQTLPSGFEIRQVDRTQEAVVTNLLELYCHDMAQWFLFDADEQGRYDYDTGKVWNEHVDVFLAYVNRVPIGFALVGSALPYVNTADAKDLDEFFVIRRHRRCGVGEALAAHVWRLYPHEWLVRVMQGNLPALPFWREIVSSYTDGAYKEEVRTVAGRTWSYFSFTSTSIRNVS